MSTYWPVGDKPPELFEQRSIKEVLRATPSEEPCAAGGGASKMTETGPTILYGNFDFVLKRQKSSWSNAKSENVGTHDENTTEEKQARP
jgi:hypothetical protein